MLLGVVLLRDMVFVSVVLLWVVVLLGRVLLLGGERRCMRIHRWKVERDFEK
jgi:hypothetical protein